MVPTDTWNVSQVFVNAKLIEYAHGAGPLNS